MACSVLEHSDYTKLENDVVYLSALQKFDEFVADATIRPEYEYDRNTGVNRQLYLPGSLVSAPVKVNYRTIYWPAIIEFSPESESSYVKSVPNPNGGEKSRVYYVTLITVDRSAWFGAWALQGSLKPFNLLTEPEKNDAAHIPNAHVVFEYVKSHIPLNYRDRLLKLSFMSFVAFNDNMRRWEIRP